MDQPVLAWLGIVVIAALAVALSRFWTRPVAGGPPDDLYADPERRSHLLLQLYELTGGDVGKWIRKSTLRQRLGWTRPQTDRICRFLIDAGFIEPVPMANSDALSDQLSAHIVYGEPLRLTAAGIWEIELAQQEGDPVERLAQVTNVTFHGPVSGTYVQAGTSASQQHHYQGGRDPSPAELQDLALRFRQALMHLEQQTRDLGLAQVATIETQQRSPEPNFTIIREAIRTLRSIAEGAAGNIAFAGLVALCDRLLR